jgi:hypothetical protein
MAYGHGLSMDATCEMNIEQAISSTLLLSSLPTKKPLLCPFIYFFYITIGFKEF